MGNTQVVRDFVAAFSENDVEKVMEFFDPGCVYDNIPVSPVTGTDAIRGVLQGFMGMASEIEWVLHQIAENDDATPRAGRRGAGR